MKHMVRRWCFSVQVLMWLSVGLSTTAMAAQSAPEPQPAETTEPLLTGYTKLDASGVPTDVRVAVTRENFTALWSLAHPTAIVTPPVVDLATGAPRWQLAARAEGATTMTATLRLPVAVLVDAWRTIRLPVPTGAVTAVHSEPLAAGGVKPSAAAVTWQGEPGQMILRIAGHTQATVVVDLELPLRLDGGQWSLALPVIPGGGTLDLITANGWEPQAPQLAFVSTVANHFIADLPTTGNLVELRVRRSDAAAPRTVHVAFEQQLQVVLETDRLRWSGELLFAIQGGSLRELRLALPPGLLLGTLESPGIAGWRQTGTTVDISWAAAVSGQVNVRATGILPRGGASGAVAVGVDCASAERQQGRLGLRDRNELTDPTAEPIEATERIVRAERLFADGDAAVTRTDPQAGEYLAVQWHDRTTSLRVRWEPLASEIHLTQHAAVVVDAQHVRVALRMLLSGHGVADGIRLRLLDPWRVSKVSGSFGTQGPGVGAGRQIPVTASLSGAGKQRTVVLNSAELFSAGTTLQLWLDADRVQLGNQFTVPDVWPTDGLLVVDHQRWLFGDDGDRRLRLTAEAHVSETPSAPLAQDFTAELPPGATWRQACERRAGTPPQVELLVEAPRLQVTASHYLVLEAERLRWSARLVFTPLQGALTELVCTLPPGARLVRSACRDLGAITVAPDGRLVATLTAPARSPITLDLDLEFSISEGMPLRIIAITTGSGDLLVAQQIVLVEDFELGLVHRTLDGLSELAQLTLPLPADVDAAQIKLRWSAQRPDWNLTLRREPLVPAGGLDGIATMIDAYGTLAPDGEVRGRATWHVLNRTRQQLRLELPAGLELWEVRVDGRQVSCRQDSTDGQAVWVPVRPLRTGEAARRVELTWRQTATDTAEVVHPLMPLFSELKRQQVLWRFAPPPGWTVTCRDGALKPIAATDADGERAKRVVEELSRLRNQGELKDNALLRCNGQLDQLELELNDYAVQMNSSSSVIANQQAKEVQTQISQLQVDRNQNSEVYGNRGGNRKALGIGKRTRDWSPSNSLQPSEEFRLPNNLPWREALVLESRTSLGDGQLPPGHRSANERTLLGIDLVGDQPVALTVRGLGGDVTVVLALTRPTSSWWPLLSSALIAITLSIGAFFVQRKKL